jgi:hypothetical protein
MEESKPTPQSVLDHDRYLARRMKESMDAAEVPSGYVIAPGKSLSTPRGVVSEGESITLVDFETREAFEQRLAEGYIIKDGEQ